MARIFLRIFQRSSNGQFDGDLARGLARFARADVRDVWETVNHAYFDPTFGGVSWETIKQSYTTQLEKVEDNDALRQLLQQMLLELGRSHFAVIPREIAVFAPEERDRIGAAGATLVSTEGAVVIAEVEPDSPAARAGLTCGAVVEAVNEHALDKLRADLAVTGWSETQRNGYVADFVIQHLQAPAGTVVTLDLRAPDALADASS